MIKGIRDIDIAGKKVFIRCDFNVPKDEYGVISDDRRIRAALPTIRYCIDNDCAVILASHFERPTPGKFDEKFSLKPIAKRLHTLLKQDVQIAENVVKQDAREKADALKQGEVLLLENLRFNAGETNNDAEFAQKLRDMADIYINDAFGASHRKHASIYALPQLFDENSRAAGFLLNKEINFFQKMLENPSRPFVAVIGGSKVSGNYKLCKTSYQKLIRLSSVEEWLLHF